MGDYIYSAFFSELTPQVLLWHTSCFGRNLCLEFVRNLLDNFYGIPIVLFGKKEKTFISSIFSETNMMWTKAKYESFA